MKTFKNILCILEPKIDNHKALTEAVKQAASQQATLHLASLTSNDSSTGENTNAEELDALLQNYRQQCQLEHFTLAIEDEDFEPVLNKMHELGCDLVIKSRRPDKELKGSLSKGEKQLLRHDACPLWLFKSSAPVQLKHIIAAVDLDDDYHGSDLRERQELNRKVMESATAIAAGETAQLTVVYAMNTSREKSLEHNPFATQSQEDTEKAIEIKRKHHQALLDDFKAQYRQVLSEELASYLTLDSILLEGAAKKVLPECVAESTAELIVIGTAARSALEKWIFGSTTESVLKHANCSVLAVKPAEFDEHI